MHYMLQLRTIDFWKGTKPKSELLRVQYAAQSQDFACKNVMDQFFACMTQIRLHQLDIKSFVLIIIWNLVFMKEWFFFKFQFQKCCWISARMLRKLVMDMYVMCLVLAAMHATEMLATTTLVILAILAIWVCKIAIWTIIKELFVENQTEVLNWPLYEFKFD